MPIDCSGKQAALFSQSQARIRDTVKVREGYNFVQQVRHQRPCVGTHKLYHMLNEPLRVLHIGRDSLFSIMKVNHLDLKPKRQYRTTIDSHHRFRKHKNLI